jgi:hypothetical protein
MNYWLCSDNPKKIFRLLCLQHRRLRRQLWLATLGGSTSARPGVRKPILKTYDFIDISNMTIPTALGGSTTPSPPIVIVILRQQLDNVILDYVYAAPDKS